MFKKSIAATAAVMLAGGLTFGLAAPSFADDSTQEVASSQDISADTQPAPTTETAPTAEPSPDTSAEPSETPSSPAPATTPATEESDDATVQPTPADHVDSAQDPAQAPVAAQPAAKPRTIAVEKFDGWDTWLISSDGSKKGPVGHVSVGEDYTPQTHLGEGQVAPQCNQLVQQDHYVGTKAQHDALIAAGNLTWTNGHMSDQNFGLNVADWTIVYGGDCLPSPQTCTSTSTGYSEDVAPEQREDGLYFEGGSGAVDWYYPTSGNLQGFTGQSITFADVAGYQPSVTIVFNRFGTSGYANLVSEWYMNGGTAGESGTFSATPSSLWWTNKIASGAGSQSDPQPLSFFVNLWPTNQLISVGPHLGSAQTSDTHSTVTGISGCANVGFVPTKPAAVVTHDQNTVTDCDAKLDVTHHSTTTTEYVWDSESHSYILGTPVTTQDEDTSVPATEEECPTVVVPPIEPPTTTPTPTPTPTETTTPAAVAPVSDDTPSADRLASTGSSLDTLIYIFVALVVAGFLCWVIGDSRRRWNANHSKK